MSQWLSDFLDACIDKLQKMDLPDTSVTRKFLFLLIAILLTISGILTYALFGDRGGTVVACGTPEQVALSKDSYTGQYVKKFLERYRQDA